MWSNFKPNYLVFWFRRLVVAYFTIMAISLSLSYIWCRQSCLEDVDTASEAKSDPGFSPFSNSIFCNIWRREKRLILKCGLYCITMSFRFAIKEVYTFLIFFFYPFSFGFPTDMLSLYVIASINRRKWESLDLYYVSSNKNAMISD